MVRDGPNRSVSLQTQQNGIARTDRASGASVNHTDKLRIHQSARYTKDIKMRDNNNGYFGARVVAAKAHRIKLKAVFLLSSFGFVQIPPRTSFFQSSAAIEDRSEILQCLQEFKGQINFMNTWKE